jgi:pyruvate-ferredoxin/flavodoxin oxidoreductase
MVLSLRDEATWGLSFPYNPFGGPVTIDRTGDAPLLAAGIMDGQLRQITADLALLRQARLELEHPETAAHRTASQINLDWADLTTDEQTKAGRLLLIGDAGLLTGRALPQLHRLLSLNLPVKVLVLSNLDLGLATSANLDLTVAAWPDTDAELSLLAMTHHHNVYIAQSALGVPEHLLETLERMLAYPGPALLHLHAPSPSQHGFPSDQTLERSQEAVACGVFPLFRYDPERPGVFGTRFDLEGNPQAETTRTPAHWVLGEQRFNSMFSPLADDAPGPLALEAYLALDPQKRRNHTPFITGATEARLAVAPELVTVCATRQSVWQMLQELAGVVTPFTARVREEIETATAANHKAELAAQAATYEARITGLREQMQKETRQALRIRLMELSGYSTTR